MVIIKKCYLVFLLFISFLDIARSLLIEGDVAVPFALSSFKASSLSSSDMKKIDRYQNRFYNRKLWDHGKVPYYFDDTKNKTHNTLMRVYVEGVTKALMKVSNCLYFREIEDISSTRNYINFTNRGDERNTEGGCWSYIGMQGGGQVINLDFHCFTVETVAHEILHALGFYHEHNRFDRDEYVTINWDNIKKDRNNLKNFEKIKGEDPILPPGRPYDFTSIMHYSAYSRSKNGQKTIEIKNCGELCSPDLTLSSDVGPRNGEMSWLDMWALNLLYICPDIGDDWKIFLHKWLE